ncbi:hypothetical protein G5I_02600 [Acromyrmex echinatior]|uniref:Uncharacterized protein n=1 Tax=Acromyrmex echinatior TaxID=103372 RepID=F4WAR0_ACREC|nr:hypothetical protein G5I_02600 [Acromyrmex echinatior]
MTRKKNMEASQNFDEFLGVYLEIMSKLLQSNREDGWTSLWLLVRLLCAIWCRDYQPKAKDNWREIVRLRMKAGDSRDLGGVTQHLSPGRRERSTTRIESPEATAEDRPPGGMIPGPGSHAGAKRIESQHDLTGKATLRYKDGESPGEAPRGHEAA